jgi:ribose 5-phosphate isomerase A
MDEGMNDDAKSRAAHAALNELPENGIIGLGTGSTVKFFVDALADVVRGGRNLTGVCTSEATRRHAAELGIPLLEDAGPWAIEVTVDGADEVADDRSLSKGAGGALTREKIVAYASKRLVIICDAGKRVVRIGEKRPVALEVLAFGFRQTMARLGAFGKPTLRDGARTDAGNLLVDLAIAPLDDPAKLDGELRSIPGIVETGLFLARSPVVYVAHEGRVERMG